MVRTSTRSAPPGQSKVMSWLVTRSMSRGSDRFSTFCSTLLSPTQARSSTMFTGVTYTWYQPSGQTIVLVTCSPGDAVSSIVHFVDPRASSSSR